MASFGATFLVHNNDATPNTANVTCSATGNLTCAAPITYSVSLTVLQTKPVTLIYNSGAVKALNTITATGSARGGSAGAFVKIY